MNYRETFCLYRSACLSWHQDLGVEEIAVTEKVAKQLAVLCGLHVSHFRS